MTTKIVKSEYIGGKRVETSESVYTIGEDYAKLGQLYYAKGTKMIMRDNPPPKSDVKAIEKDIEAVDKEILEQMARISRYETANSNE